MEKCKAFTKKDKPCSRNAKINGFCTQHKDYIPKPSKIQLPRLPENISQKLANCSQIGLNKIKEQIIQMWLEDGGYIMALDSKRRIPVGPDVYKELLKIFNDEEAVLSQIFYTEKTEEEVPKPHDIPIGSTNPPKAPVNVSYYSNFIPTVGRIMTKENIKAFDTLKKFIQDYWIKEGNILHHNFIYLTSHTYKSAESFFRLKIREATIDVDYWTNYLMSNIFRVGKENKQSKPSKDQKDPPKGSFIPPKEDPPKGSSKSIRKIQYKNIEEELKKLFPDKNIKIFMEIIKVNSSVYKVNSKQEIHKLYIQFHPDKCGIDPKIVKLCGAFCAKLENIKKAWEYNQNPKACSPARTRGDDTETILKILNDEI